MLNVDISAPVRIAEINDEFRSSGKNVMLSCGVESVSDLRGLLARVREFDKFDGNNDPWGEHDYGRIVWQGDKVLWKIDYFDENYRTWEDPLSPNCRRVITVMLAEDY
jgi:hypothetical protein